MHRPVLPLALGGEGETGLGGAEGAVIVTPVASAPADGPTLTPTRTEVYPRPNPRARVGHAARRKAGPRARARVKRLSRAVLVRGRVRPAHAGRVRIRLQRKLSGRWVQVRRTRVIVRHGRFRKLFRGLRAGRFRVRAAYLGSSTARVSSSHARRFHIRP